MPLPYLDSPAPGNQWKRRNQRERRHFPHWNRLLKSEPTNTTLYGSRAHVKAALFAVSVANILSTDYFQIYAFVHYKGLR